MSTTNFLVLLLAALCIMQYASATLPSKWKESYVEGKLKSWYANPNAYGCKTGKYTDKKKWGYPYCPGDTIEVHGDFANVQAKSRDNKGAENHVSCMTCDSFGSSSTDFTGNQVFKMKCDGSNVGQLKEYFSELVYGANEFALKTDGTFSTGTNGLYQRWTVGPDNKSMTWTTHHDNKLVCDGICNLRYTLVEPATNFGSQTINSIWWTITNYYEIGVARCDIHLVSI